MAISLPREPLNNQPEWSSRPLEVGRLQGQWAMITGAGRGIGEEIAVHFAKAGASLVLTELPSQLELVQAVAERLQQAYGTRVFCEPLDLRDLEQIEGCVSSVESQVSEGIHYLVNNAGVNLLVPALNVTQEDWDFVVDINLKGTFFLTKAVAKSMVRRKSGSIIMIASQHGVVGNENRAPYCASKAGLIHLTKALAVEWAKYGIRVNAVSPTFVVTDANESFVNDTQFQRMNLPRIPLRKFAVPEDIASSVLFLAADSAGMITGHNLVVDGGWTAI